MLLENWIELWVSEQRREKEKQKKLTSLTCNRAFQTFFSVFPSSTPFFHNRLCVASGVKSDRCVVSGHFNLSPSRNMSERMDLIIRSAEWLPSCLTKRFFRNPFCPSNQEGQGKEKNITRDLLKKPDYRALSATHSLVKVCRRQISNSDMFLLFSHKSNATPEVCDVISEYVSDYME